MSLEKANITWSAKQLTNMLKNGKINLDHIVQRGLVWERSRKSALIESMIVGYPVPPIFAKRINDSNGSDGYNVYYIMDGKQRLSAVKEYLCDEFSLSMIEPVTYFDDKENKEITIDISGKKFSELPDSLKNHLETFTFSVIYFDNLEKDEERELFKRLNAGRPLSTKSRLLASCNNIEELMEIGSHELFDEMLTKKSKENKNQISIVMKTWCMLNQDIEDISFESKYFNPMIEQAEISEDEKSNIIEVFNYVKDVHSILKEKHIKKIPKKLYTETHMISLVPFVRIAINRDIETEKMADWVIDFFGDEVQASCSERYNSACVGGSAKNQNIVIRNEELKKSFESFFDID